MVQSVSLHTFQGLISLPCLFNIQLMFRPSWIQVSTIEYRKQRLELHPCVW